MPKTDWDKTYAACFLDRRSYITPDGREILFGDDWAGRRAAVYLRDDGKCTRCGIDRCFNGSVFTRMHVHHIIPKSQGRRDDRAANLACLCYRCHLGNGHKAGR